MSFDLFLVFEYANRDETEPETPTEPPYDLKRYLYRPSKLVRMLGSVKPLRPGPRMIEIGSGLLPGLLKLLKVDLTRLLVALIVGIVSVV